MKQMRQRTKLTKSRPKNGCMGERRDSTKYVGRVHAKRRQETPRYTGANTFNSHEILAPPRGDGETLNTWGFFAPSDNTPCVVGVNVTVQLRCPIDHDGGSNRGGPTRILILTCKHFDIFSSDLKLNNEHVLRRLYAPCVQVFSVQLVQIPVNETYA
jgi:hypothetical protein